MSCYKCSWISGHAPGCPEGVANEVSSLGCDVSTLEERLDEKDLEIAELRELSNANALRIKELADEISQLTDRMKRYN